VLVTEALGRQSSALRVLALAVTALVLVDPVLVRAVGFQLSVAASTGIILVARPIARRLPMPSFLAEVVGVTLAAQLAVAPIALTTFGGVPVASLPANLLAAPAAAPVMVWGATAGVVAGIAGGPLAAVLQFPTRLLLGWIRLVGSIAGRVPLGELHGVHCVALVLAALVLAQSRREQRGRRAVATAVVLLAVLQPAWSLRALHLEGAPVAEGVSLWTDHGAAVVVVEARADPVRALEALRRAGVRRVDLLVAVTGGAGVGDVVRALDARYDVRETWAPAGHAIRGARVPPVGMALTVGAFTVDAVASDPRLVVHVGEVR